MAHIRQSRPDPGIGFQVNVLKTSLFVPSSLGGSAGMGFKEGGACFAAGAPLTV